MENKLFLTNVCSFLEGWEQELLNYRFREELNKSDQIEIAVGFCSHKSLRELDALIFQKRIKRVCLILGMYYLNGIPESLHKLALEINERWMRAGIGEIRLVHSCKYHGKLYCFFKNNQIFSAIFGSPNLSFLTETWFNNQDQHEMAFITNNPIKIEKFPRYLKYLKSKNISENIEILERYKSHWEEESYFQDEKKQSKIVYKKFL
ncbi:hypothetical protein OVS_00615 [Mycoplasma ovis str. Michigan]|uniref:Restriction endonuclease type II NgoFVII N-terminal domain-containing protein n=1 Tax=Mycoplasma ovis str. Michigan TaxID=1415773 RepID=A0ABM5P175_9MOLU|nr:restriction endonuclease PLD domain-containing protein [Mycoplasma ovis]AHC40113.1 hypothetical protein OVS_00615 [Mycoplasma ovis str. Michigan]